MNRKKLAWFGGGGALAMAAAGAAAFAMAPERGPARADLNGDGRVENAELQQSARQRFAELDTNKDGKLVGDELPRRGHGRRGHGGHGRHGPDQVQSPQPVAQPDQAAPAQAQVLPAPHRRNMDANADGGVDLREFWAGYSARMLRADTNGDGALSAEELAARPRRGGHGRH